MRVIREVDEQRRLGIDTDNSIQLIKNCLVRDKEEGKSKRGIKQESRRYELKKRTREAQCCCWAVHSGAHSVGSSRLPFGKTSKE